MNNWCICWFFTHIVTGILIVKWLNVQRPYKLLGVKGLVTIKLQKLSTLTTSFGDLFAHTISEPCVVVLVVLI
jgi:hypothetical protein